MPKLDQPKQVNNAGYLGAILDSDAFVRAFEAAGGWPGEQFFNWNEFATQNFEMAEECLKINYYGVKRMIEAHISLLQLSDSARIVNVSSLSGLLKLIKCMTTQPEGERFDWNELATHNY
ncbi:hypothetical protein Ddye_017857 [Dipteronia dyeriana]|uniref:Uncharacterized protein n=1 Tax=Dipteronia dyeriana TaxID=168575 RepID=A0AAD9UA22_9ROSI|nr:hypothetical protein Ddye_017857 [Dipteronia dyeriana]